MSEFAEAAFKEMRAQFDLAAKDQLPDGKIRSIVEDEVENCRDAVRQMRGSKADIPPRLVVVFEVDKETEQYDTAVCYFDSFGEERFDRMEYVGKTIFENSGLAQPALAVILLSAVWVKRFDKAKGETHDRAHVSDYPDREEKIMVAALTMDGRNDIGLSDIERDDDGDLKDAGPVFYPYEDVMRYEDEPEGSDNVDAPLLRRFYKGYLERMKQELTSN